MDGKSGKDTEMNVKIKAIEKTIYQTSDGEEHLVLSNALDHQRKLNVQAFFDLFSLRRGEIEINEVVDLICNHYFDLKKAINVELEDATETNTLP